MKTDIQKQVLEQTWHEVVYFQLRSLSLPTDFEREIQNTEVKGQDILKTEKEADRDEVQFKTDVIVARLAQNATLEKAYGEGNKTVYAAEATASTVGKVIELQSEAYGGMKETCGLNNDQLLKYMKNNLIKDYSSGKIAIGLP